MMRFVNAYTRAVGRWTVTACAAALIALVAASAAGPAGRHRVQHELESKRDAVEQARVQERELGAAIADQSAALDKLQADVAARGRQVAALEGALASARRRLSELERQLSEERATLGPARHESHTAERRLRDRIVAIYTSDEPTTAEVIVGAKNLDAVSEQLEAENRIAAQDDQLVDTLRATRNEVRTAIARTARLRREQAERTRSIATDTANRRHAYQSLVAKRDQAIALQAERRRARRIELQPGSSGRSRLARVAVRAALGAAPRRDRRRSAGRDTDSRLSERHRHLRGLDERVRARRRHPARRRRRDRLRPRLQHLSLSRAAGLAGTGDRCYRMHRPLLRRPRADERHST